MSMRNAIFAAALALAPLAGCSNADPSPAAGAKTEKLAEMTIDGRVERVVAGQTVHIPAGVVHSGVNVGPSPGRRLLTFSPAGMEEFFREAGAASPEAESDRAATADAAVRHGWRFVD